MDGAGAIEGLSALAHPGRLAAFRLLVQAGEPGLAAGEIAKATGTVPQTLSGNLLVLSHAGLVTSRREGRSIIYAANYERMGDLLAFLMEDCCSGSPQICAPLVEVVERAACCTPQRAKQ
jgi:DNA-binding transcriptional ArsR family regulator